MLASATLNTSPPASGTLTGLSVLRGVRAPLRPICFPVYASSVLFDVTRSLVWRIRLPFPGGLPLSLNASGMDAQTEVRIIISSTDATLGMGGWLSLTQSGLSPDKKRQAYSWRTRVGWFCGKAQFYWAFGVGLLRHHMEIKIQNINQIFQLIECDIFSTSRSNSSDHGL